MPEVRWRPSRLASLMVVLVASVAALGSVRPSIGASTDPHIGDPPRCGRSTGVADRGRSAPTPSARMDARLDAHGTLRGYRLSGTLGSRPWSVTLTPEAFTHEGPDPFFVYGDANTRRGSLVRVVDLAHGCLVATYANREIVRSAVVDLSGRWLYLHAVSRVDRSDLGVVRRALAGGPAEAVLSPVAAQSARGSSRAWSTELAWGPGRRLAVQACAPAGCRTHVLDERSGRVEVHDGPGQGSLERVDPNGITVRTRCPVAPCPLVALARADARGAPGGDAASGTVITATGPSRPTPANSAPWGQNEVLEYRWRAGDVPPSWMQPGIRDGAAGVRSSRQSRAATFAYDADADDWIGYMPSLPCGSDSIGCAAKSVGSWWQVGLRVHGHRFDWGTLLWCDALETPRDGCFDVARVALHELGHIVGLGHYEDAYGAGESPGPYSDSVMHEVTRARGASLWNVRDFGRCDVTTLQRRYDMLDTYDRYSTCARHDTTIVLQSSDTSIIGGQSVTFTATLRVLDRDAYGKLGGNRVSGRSVNLQRRVPGSDAWYTFAMSPSGSDGTYTLQLNPRTTYEYRATFGTPSNEGLDGNSSVVIVVRATGCTDPCPTSDEADQ